MVHSLRRLAAWWRLQWVENPCPYCNNEPTTFCESCAEVTAIGFGR